MDASRNRGFRGDIEGLRGVAVLLVVLDHLKAPGFRAGFLGVDVFFVISGYLITSLLAAEYAGRGTISLRGFYARRARRILPAALTVIGAGILAGGLLNPLRAVQIRHDAAWAVVFASNVHTMQETTSYFSQSLVTSSPFEHYWSLAVEEQFYLVWPALFVLAARFIFGSAAHWRRRVAATVCVVGAGSLVWSAVATARAPTPAYFSTFTRAWELALGALIGIAVRPTTQLPQRVARAASCAGGALLVASCVVIKGGTPYPGAIALLPTASTALLIVGGLGERAPRPNRALATRPLRFVGRISYSLYLWHWPLIVFAAALYPTLVTTVQVRLVILALAFAIATTSYYLVEQPGRRIGHRERARPRRQRWNLAAATVGACVLVGAFVGLAAAGREGPAFVAGAAASSGAAGRSSLAFVVSRRELPRQAIYERAVSTWQRAIRAGLKVTELPPNLRPLLPHLEKGSPPPCIRGLPGVPTDECVVGNPAAKRVAVLDGDSHAEMLRNAVWRSFDPKTWSIHIFARDACGWAGTAENAASTATECARLQAESLRRIRELRPNVLLLSEHLVVQPFRSQADIAHSLAALSRPAKTTIVLGHTPLPQPWSMCLVGNDISRCFTVLDAAFRHDRAVEQRLATRAGAMFVDTSAWVCVRAGAQTVCPPVIAGVPTYKDTTHIGPEYQFKLIPIVRALLLSAGVDVGVRRG
ncbi:MAG TPA: acyltransferase family protein [Gaiellaceae bacterium]|nr:acyltransferase family protein [Gaiellaceae bacterium]